MSSGHNWCCIIFNNNFDCGALQPAGSVSHRPTDVDYSRPCLLYTVMSVVLIMAKGLITIYANCVSYTCKCIWFLCVAFRFQTANHRTHLNSLKVLMNKHAMKRITFGLSVGCLYWHIWTQKPMLGGFCMFLLNSWCHFKKCESHFRVKPINRLFQIADKATDNLRQ